MFFQNPFQTAFLEGPSARLASKMRFWTDFRYSKGPKIDPRGDLFPSKGIKKGISPKYGVPPGADLDVEWRRKRRKTIQGSNLMEKVTKMTSRIDHRGDLFGLKRRQRSTPPKNERFPEALLENREAYAIQ